MSDLIERLQEKIEWELSDANALNLEAADEIERLTAENTLLRGLCFSLGNRGGIPFTEVAALIPKKENHE